MNYIYSCYTDIGNRKENQDSLLVKTYNDKGNVIILLAVCDGVGGLKNGAIISKQVCDMLSYWFDNDLLHIINDNPNLEIIKNNIKQCVLDINNCLYMENKYKNIESATTLSLYLQINSYFITLNIGDSRIYKIDNKVSLLTKDDSYIQAQVDLGNIKKEDAKNDKRQNILLKSIASKENIIFDVKVSKILTNTLFLLCSDGFWHYLDVDDLYQKLNFNNYLNEESLTTDILNLVNKVKKSGENDNISVILLKVNID